MRLNKELMEFYSVSSASQVFLLRESVKNDVSIRVSEKVSTMSQTELRFEMSLKNK